MISSLAIEIFGFLFRLQRHFSARIGSLRGLAICHEFGACGANVSVPGDGVFLSPSTIYFGSDVSVGYRAHFSAVNTEIRIGNKVIFAPEVAIIGGNHNTSVVGEYMFDVKEKRPSAAIPNMT